MIYTFRMHWDYMLTQLWRWVADTGINLAILIVAAFLVPRAGRLLQRWIHHRSESSDPNESKSQLALAGASIYIAQLVAYFVITVFFLQQLGFSMVGATIPATIASAAIGLGAQSIIADFLAGFFIITEKQYGVGDWVRFEGNGVEVEGTVIQVTMRATRIRTLSEQTVIIPNSTARVCINSSHYWSSAVVVMDVPLLGSASANEAIDRTEQAARRALEHPDVKKELLGELDVQPAVSVDAPTVVGMPWTMKIRLIIQVKAAMQWMVERAIRIAIVDEFWSEYGSATTMTGELQHQLRLTPQQTEESELNLGLSDPGATAAATEEISKITQAEALPSGPPTPQSILGNVLTFGGHVRTSTTMLSALMIVLLILRAMMVTIVVDGETLPGPLAPPAQVPAIKISDQ